MAISTYRSFFKVLKKELITINSNNVGVLWRSILVGSFCPAPADETAKRKSRIYAFPVQDEDEKEEAPTFKSVIGWRVANIFAWPYFMIVLLKKFTLEGIDRLTLSLTDKNNQQPSPAWAVTLKAIVSIAFTPAQLITFTIAKVSDVIIDHVLKPLKKLSSTGVIFDFLKKKFIKLSRLPRYRFNKPHFWQRTQEHLPTDEEETTPFMHQATQQPIPEPATIRAQEPCELLSEYSLMLIKGSLPNHQWSISELRYDAKKSPHRIVYNERNQVCFTIDATGISTNHVDLATYVQMLKCFKATSFKGTPYATICSLEAKELMSQAYRQVYGYGVNLDLYITLEQRTAPRPRL